VQQLSLPLPTDPQSVVPGPLGAQLGRCEPVSLASSDPELPPELAELTPPDPPLLDVLAPLDDGPPSGPPATAASSRLSEGAS